MACTTYEITHANIFKMIKLKRQRNLRYRSMQMKFFKKYKFQFNLNVEIQKKNTKLNDHYYI